jgi:transposase
MRRNQAVLSLTDEQREDLTQWAHSRTLPAGDVFRARLVLALAEGQSYRHIMTTLQTTAPTISRWKQRFEKDGIEGLNPRHKGSRPRVADAAVQARIARKTQQKPSDGSTHWSCRKMASVGASTRPCFAWVRKTAIQALDRLDPVLPLSPGRAERHGFEYYRHGTLSLYAALEVRTGRVHGMTAGRHTSQEFIAFLEGLVARAKWAREIHVVLDNLSAHKTKDVERFLAEHPKVRFHFTPTYSSWLNQVELWFAKIQRDVIRRDVFTSVADLGNKLRKYIRAYSKSAKPFRWTYTDLTRRIRANRIAGTAYTTSSV